MFCLKLSFFITVIFFEAFNCLKPENFCFFIESTNLICKRYQCEENLCSFNKKSCITLRTWSHLNDNSKNVKRIEEYFKFFSQIKECTKSDHINLKPIVCSNKKKCDRENQSFFRNIIGIKPKECFCSGKLNYDCGNEYCSLNKLSCLYLFKNSYRNSKLISKKINNNCS
jgi:hypothetical protein